MPPSNKTHLGPLKKPLLLVVFFAVIALVPQLRAADNDDFDTYKIKFNAFWFYTQPTGTFTGTGGNGTFDFQKDVSFQSYSTFSGGVDWKLTRKNHLLFTVTPFDRTKSFVASRTITFQGQTFNAGLSASCQPTGERLCSGLSVRHHPAKTRAPRNQSAARSLRRAGEPGCLGSSFKWVAGGSLTEHKGICELRCRLPDPTSAST